MLKKLGRSQYLYLCVLAGSELTEWQSEVWDSIPVPRRHRIEEALIDRFLLESVDGKVALTDYGEKVVNDYEDLMSNLTQHNRKPQMLSTTPVQQAVSNSFDLPTPYQQFIHKSRYARWDETNKRRETWEETVARYRKFFEKDNESTAKFASYIPWDRIEVGIRNLAAMPSMRVLMTAGPALANENIAGYNCSYVSVDHPRVFAEILYILMCGTGAGFSVESRYTMQLPAVPDKLVDVSDSFTIPWKIIVGDSKQGWAKAYNKLIIALYRGEIPEWDVSLVRAAGVPLKTFGGRASGPEPLVGLFKDTVAMFKAARGRKLSTLECHDLVCKIAEIVVVGGVRRSALISLSDLNDNALAKAKSGAWWEKNGQRSLANNSAAYECKPTAEVFMAEFLSLVESKSGERGIFSREAAKKICKSHGRDHDHEWGTNPCLIGSTLVAVADGRNAVSIEALAASGEEFPVYCSSKRRSSKGKHTNRWKSVPSVKPAIAFPSGYKETVEVFLEDGSSFTCTPDHRLALHDRAEWIEAKDSVGHVLKDLKTFNHGGYRRMNGKSNAHSSQHRLIFEYFDVDRIRPGEVIDHVVSKGGDHISNLQKLSKATHDAKTSSERRGHNNPVFKRPTEVRRAFAVLAAFTRNGYQGGKMKAMSVDQATEIVAKWRDVQVKSVKRPLNKGIRVTNVIERETEHVYDVMVKDEHNFYIITKSEDEGNIECSGVLVHNCSEIILRPAQFCNLSEVVVQPRDTLETLKEKVELATILGTLQSSLTDFGFLSKRWTENTEEERLLGVSLTGIMDNATMSGSNGHDILEEWLTALRLVADEVNLKYATILGIPASAAITCVKPSGTVSQLVDSASGIHARYAPQYIRTVRADMKDPLTLLMQDAGFPCEPDVTAPHATMVFSFPIKCDKEAVFRDDRTALEQLELWKIYQVSWCHHKPSITVYVLDHEWMDVQAWCYKNFDLLSGVSFLPSVEHSYKQAPYQDCTVEEYEALLAKIPEIDWTLLSKYESTDLTEGAQTLACSAGGCEI